MLKRSYLELQFEQQLIDAGITNFKTEYKCVPGRKWRFDFAFPDLKIAVEIEGGTFNGGRHVTGKGYEADCYKQSEAMIRGWHVLRFTGRMINSETLDALNYLIKLIGVRETEYEYLSRSSRAMDKHRGKSNPGNLQKQATSDTMETVAGSHTAQENTDELVREGRSKHRSSLRRKVKSSNT